MANGYMPEEISVSTRTRKRLKGSLLDLASREVVLKAEFEIAKTVWGSGLPRFKVTATMWGYRPELVNQRYILRLADDLEGEIQVKGIVGVPSKRRMRVGIHLQDAVWNSVEWFDHLAQLRSGCQDNPLDAKAPP